MTITAGRRIYLAVLFGGLFVGLASATQYVGWAYVFNPRLGFALVQLPWFTVYWPVAFLNWIFTIDRYGPQVIDTGGMIFVGCMMVPFMLAVFLSRKGADRKVKEFGADRWGTLGDAVKAGIAARLPIGVIVGCWERPARILSFDGPEHQLVAGGSRSGKGAGHVVPTLLAWPDSVLTYDPKGENYDITASFRQKFSHVFYVNFAREGSACFNPLSEIRPGPREIGDVQNLVRILSDPGGNKDSLNFFDLTASALLTAVILHQLYAAPDHEKNLAAVRLRLLNLKPLLSEMACTLHRYRRDRSQLDGLARDDQGKPIAESVREVELTAVRFLAMPERLLNDIAATASSYLEVFADDLVAEKTSRSDFRIGDLVCSDNPVSLYLQTPPADEERLRPLTRLVLSQVARSLMHSLTTDVDGRPRKHRLLFQIDEFPSLGKLGFFAANLRVMAGYGIKAQLTVQSFKDIVSAYGSNNTILDNMHITVAFAAADDESCSKISSLTGRATEYRESRSRNSGAKLFTGTRSTSYSEQQRPLLEAGDVRQLPYDEQLVFVTGAKPFRCKKIRYWEMSPFRERAANIRGGDTGPDQSYTLDVPGTSASDASLDRWKGIVAVGTDVNRIPVRAQADAAKLARNDAEEPVTPENARSIVRDTGLDLAAMLDEEYRPDDGFGP